MSIKQINLLGFKFEEISPNEWLLVHWRKAYSPHMSEIYSFHQMN